MNIPNANPNPRRRQSASAVILFIALLALMLILITASGKALFRLHQEMKLLDRQQIERLNASQTDAPAHYESK